jgi:hypothetical protein
VASDNVTATYSRVAGESVAGSPYTISATLNATASVLSNYSISYKTATFTLTQATASVTPNAASKTYGTADPTLTGALVGFVTSDNVTASYSRTPGETVAGGPYSISATLNASAAVLANYSITYHTAQFTINKAAASVTPSAASKTYGTADPALTGALSGFLPADNVTASYSRTAGETAGSYIISATLSPASVLGNYVVSDNTAQLTITQAGSGTAMQASATAAMVGSTITWTVTSTSATSGMPTGTVSIFDGSTPLGTTSLSACVASYSNSSLAVGTHSITAVYNGDTNFFGSTSTANSLQIQDFSISSSGPGGSSGSGLGTTIIVTPGGSTAVDVAIVPSTGQTFPVSAVLTVTGLPSGATATLNSSGWTALTSTSWQYPAFATMGQLSIAFQLPAQLAAHEDRQHNKLPPVFLGILLLPFACTLRRYARQFASKVVLLLLAIAGITAIAGLSGCASSSNGFLVERTYNVTITLTAGSVSHSTNVTLKVE